eukprot:3694484-Heterocapsa_arctica.AAC.1
MLRDGVVDHLAFATNAIELDPPGAAVVLADHHGVLLLDHRGAAQEAPKLRLVVDNAHVGAGERRREVVRRLAADEDADDAAARTAHLA